MSDAVAKRDSLIDQSDYDTSADSVVVKFLQSELRSTAPIVSRSHLNGSSRSKPLGSVENGLASLHVGSPRFQRCWVALRLLSDAYEYARQVGLPSWDFAEEIDSLRRHGLTNGDLRWLVCNGFVEHGCEVTALGQQGRKFQRDSRLSFSSETCFVLTETGAMHLREFKNDDVIQSTQANSINELDDPDDSPIPTWDRERQELRLGNTIVKQFKVPARNQEIILAVFQEEEWPAYIDDPLPRDPEIDPKRRLHDTIGSLNRSQKKHLIQFRGNGSGEGVLWELVKPAGASD